MTHLRTTPQAFTHFGVRSHVPHGTRITPNCFLLNHSLLSNSYCRFYRVFGALALTIFRPIVWQSDRINPRLSHICRNGGLTRKKLSQPWFVDLLSKSGTRSYKAGSISRGQCVARISGISTCRLIILSHFGGILFPIKKSS